MRQCECDTPKDVFNQVCGVCLLPLFVDAPRSEMKLSYTQLQLENQRLREALTKDALLEIVEEWQMIWRNQKINPEDTMRYRRRALSVDANMRSSLARMIREKILKETGE